MSTAKILVVEDAPDISSLLKFYFTSKGFEVLTAFRGQSALDICRKTPPNLVLLDVGLPDMSGYEVGKLLRAGPRTRHIPIIFLTAYGERQDRLRGLGEVQAQYYIVKPFDIEEVHTIVRNQIDDSLRKNQLHPVTNLPTGELINTHLRRLIETQGWALGTAAVNGYETFIQSYGLFAGEAVLEATAIILNDVLNQFGEDYDFLGQMSGGPQFMFTAVPQRMKLICEQVAARFDEQIGLHYHYHDRERGFIEVSGDHGTVRQVPIMSLSIGVVTSDDGPFHDIRELQSVADQARHHALMLATSDTSQSTIVFGNQL